MATAWVLTTAGVRWCTCACEIVAVHGSQEHTVAFAKGTVVKTRRAESAPWPPPSS